MNFHRNLFIALLIPSILLAVLMYSFQDFYILQFKTIAKSFFIKKSKVVAKPIKPVFWNHTEYNLLDENFDIIGDAFDSYILLNSEKLLVKRDDLYKIIDSKGNIVTPQAYKTASLIRGKYIFATDENDRQIIINFDGKELVSTNQFIDIYAGNYLVLKLDDNTYVIYDDNFNKITEVKSTRVPQIINNKYVKIQNNSLVSIVDFNHNTIIPFEYENIETDKLIENHFRIRVNHKEGIINDKNEIVIPPIFSTIKVYEENGERFYIVKRDNSYAKFNLKGEFFELEKIPSDTLLVSKTPIINKIEKTVVSNIPIRHIKRVDTKKRKGKQRIDTRRKQRTVQTIPPKFMEEETYKKLYDEYLIEKEINRKFAKLQGQPKHKTNYKSDFLASKKQGDFVRLICHEDNNFCNLSKNALSAKYAGKESIYAINRNKISGKYYFEYQIFDSEDEYINTYTRFGIYKQSKIDNKLDDNRIITTYDLKSGDIIGIAIDFDNGLVHHSINGNWKSNPHISKSAHNKFLRNKEIINIPAIVVAGYKEHIIVNFGAQPFKYKMPEDYKKYQ